MIAVDAIILKINGIRNSIPGNLSPNARQANKAINAGTSAISSLFICTIVKMYRVNGTHLPKMRIAMERIVVVSTNGGDVSVNGCALAYIHRLYLRLVCRGENSFLHQAIELKAAREFI